MNPITAYRLGPKIRKNMENWKNGKRNKKKNGKLEKWNKRKYKKIIIFMGKL